MTDVYFVLLGVALGWLLVGAYLAGRSMMRTWWDSVPTMEREEFERWLEERKPER